MNSTDMDWQLIKCVGFLHATDSLTKDDPVPLQAFLEEAIKSKTGVTKDFTALVTAAMKQERVEEIKPAIVTYEDSKEPNSDNELELDLFKDDLMCVVCNLMDVGARNRLLECSDCHALYHQECHRPIVINQDTFESWVCQNCKEASRKKAGASPAVSTTSSTHSSKSGSSEKVSSKSSHSKDSSKDRHSSSDKYSKSSSSNKVSKSSSSSSRNVTPNINIINADKRIQSMKKKAAKLHEKRKLPR